MKTQPEPNLTAFELKAFLDLVTADAGHRTLLMLRAATEEKGLAEMPQKQKAAAFMLFGMLLGPRFPELVLQMNKWRDALDQIEESFARQRRQSAEIKEIAKATALNSAERSESDI
jgi:hypothetical protein